MLYLIIIPDYSSPKETIGTKKIILQKASLFNS